MRGLMIAEADTMEPVAGCNDDRSEFADTDDRLRGKLSAVRYRLGRDDVYVIGELPVASAPARKRRKTAAG
jgi:hypothetical protein